MDKIKYELNKDAKIYLFLSYLADRVQNFSFKKIFSEEFDVYTCTVEGHAVAQLVEARRYKSEASRFDSFRLHYGPGVDSDSSRHEYLLPSCADCLKIWTPQPPATRSACSGLYILHLLVSCRTVSCVKAHYVMQHAHNFEGLALNNSALSHGSMKQLSCMCTFDGMKASMLCAV
jgi:hypothetical protein